MALVLVGLEWRDGGRAVIADLSHAAALSRLFAWDAPFLPVVGEIERVGDAVRIECSAPGARLAEIGRWPRPLREAVAVQLDAAASFLFERGWLPTRGLLRSCRVSRGADGVWLRIGALPRWRLEDPRLERQLRRRPVAAESFAATAVLPLLAAVLPERLRGSEAAARRHRPWEVAMALLESIVGRPRSGGALRHPLGRGRMLWSRRVAVPESGVFRVEDDELSTPALAAARLRAAARGVALDAAVGAFDEAELARRQARAAAAGQEAFLLTRLAVTAAPHLTLANEGDVVWTLALEVETAQEHAAAAIEVGRARPILAKAVLAAGAGKAFTSPPVTVAAADDTERYASAPARELLAWLRCVPVGLTVDEMTRLGDAPSNSLEELERLRLAQRSGDRWIPLVAGESDPERARALTERLPSSAVSVLVARAAAGEEARPLLSWCESCLDRGEAEEVRRVTRTLVARDEFRAVATEAALALGRLAEAERILGEVGGDERGPVWHLLEAWWADQAGLPTRAAEALARSRDGEFPRRLEARRAYLEAERQRRAGDADGERRGLERAARLAASAVPEASMVLAARAGCASLRAWRRKLGAAWQGDLAARTYHLLGMEAHDRGATAAAMTALRAALRSASGENSRLVGEIHADVGAVAILADRPAIAERHLALAQRHLELCGSRRAVTIVQANRAVLACDRLRWRQARELVLASRALRGGVEDAAFWLEEAELVRAELARGALDAVARALPGLTESARRFHQHAVLGHSVAALCGHLALARGDLAAAAAAAGDAEPGEAELIAAVVAAGNGIDPPMGLTSRWGVTGTASILAAWRRADEPEARRRAAATRDRDTLEAAVALARFAAILGRGGFPAGEEWDALVERAVDDLEDADLAGWAAILRQVAGGDATALIEALAQLLGAGSGALAGERLRALCSALHAPGIEICRRGVTIARWGETAGVTTAVDVEEIGIRVPGEPGRVGRKALTALGHFLAAHLPDEPEAVVAGSSSLIGSSPALATLRGEIERWGPLPANVLILGEPGTGKELVARELHRTSGRTGRFVAVNCAGLPAALLEGELFGVARGAFTGADRDRAGLVEAAEHGTLFLDEVGELPLELQGKLLRLLQEREVRRVGSTSSRIVDVRFVAATNRDLTTAVTEGRFRRDLHHRLAVAVLIVPPLRERGEDVIELANHFISACGQRFGRPGVKLSPAAAALLRRGAWEGNVRELDTVVQRAVAAARAGEALGPERFPGLVPGAPPVAAVLPWEDAVTAFRREYFSALLRECGGNRSEAARRAGITRQALLYHLRLLGITQT